MSRRIYMDNSATSFPKPPGVMEAMVDFATRCGASAGVGWLLHRGLAGIRAHDRALCRLFLDAVDGAEGLRVLGPAALVQIAQRAAVRR